MGAETVDAGYAPALRFRILTPLYDPFLRLVFREAPMKARLVAEADLADRERVLDVGCGTGTLTRMLKLSRPTAEVVGLDPDPSVLARAAAKAQKSGVTITFREGRADDLPYPGESFGLVVMSLMLHHLPIRARGKALVEAGRVLGPGGRFLALDFGTPQNGLMRSLGRVSEMLEETADGVGGRYPGMFRAAGFREVEDVVRFMTVLGSVALYRGRKPG